jgi:hypothetical protein
MRLHHADSTAALETKLKSLEPQLTATDADLAVTKRDLTATNAELATIQYGLSISERIFEDVSWNRNNLELKNIEISNGRGVAAEGPGS